MDFQHIMEQFPTEETAYNFLEQVRWERHRACPHCSTAHTGKRYANFQYHCSKCRKRFSVLTHTYLQNTRLPLQKWFFAFQAVQDGQLDIAKYRLQHYLGVRYETASKMVCTIRCMVKDNQIKVFKDALETLVVVSMKVTLKQ